MISLYSHDGDYSIRINDQELMSTRQSHSEQVLAEVVCNEFKGRDVHILIGGLGFGFTLKSVLENITDRSTVVIAELMACVIAWNQNPELPLAKELLADPRCTVVQGDVGEVIGAHGKKYDAIILDVDNGPEAITTESNNSLYTKQGLRLIKGSLNPGGVLGIWSVTGNKAFETLMKQIGFRVATQTAKARPGKGAVHTLFLGYL